ncbi:MAG: hypothetical protein OEZ10_05855 [Gammaproteobacteria bacterium]|nr:hypothetical protein [Gammaproteobacteria bacterium]
MALKGRSIVAACRYVSIMAMVLVGAGGISPVLAETVHVTDKLTVPVFPGPTDVQPASGQLKTGDEPEVVQRQGAYTQIRLGGVEGWVESRFLSRQQPSAAVLKEVRKQLNDARVELRTANDKVMILEKQLGSITEQHDLARQNDEARLQAESEMRDALAAAETRAKMAEAGINIVWIAVAVAALIVGFFAGIWWDREQNRKKLGGMHIRIRGI